MITNEQSQTLLNNSTLLKSFLTNNEVLFECITDQELIQDNSQTNDFLQVYDPSYSIVTAIGNKTNLLTIFPDSFTFAGKVFFQLYNFDPFLGKTLFLLPDTKDCKFYSEVFSKKMFKEKKLNISYIQNLDSLSQETIFGDVLVSSGPIIQSVLMDPTKHPSLIAWLSSLPLVVIPGLQFLPLTKKHLIFSLLEVLRPQQVFLSTVNTNNLEQFQTFRTELTSKETSLITVKKDQTTKTYFTIQKDFTFAKRIELFKLLLQEDHAIVIFTHDKSASFSVYNQFRKPFSGKTPKVINLDQLNNSKITILSNYITSAQPHIYITSRPFPEVTLPQTNLTIFFSGLPVRTSELFTLERSVKSSQEHAEKNILLLGVNEYDRLIVTNKDLCKAFLQTSGYQFDFIHGSILSRLFIVLLRFKKTLPLSNEQEELLTNLHLAYKSLTTNTLELTQLGKLFMRDYIRFKKKKYTIYFTPEPKNVRTTKMIDLEDLQVLYQPGTIHNEGLVLQQVTSVKQYKHGYKKPIFTSIEEKGNIKRLYNHNNYRTFVESTIDYNQDTMDQQGLLVLTRTPKTVVTSYIDKSVQPYVLKIKRKPIIQADTEYIFGQVLQVLFYEEPMCMAYVVHASIYAMRILYDVDYKNFDYALSTKQTEKGVKLHELLFIDRTLSDLLLGLDIEKVIEITKQVLDSYFSSIEPNILEVPKQEFTAVVLPLPHKRYHPLKNELFSYSRVLDCLRHLHQELIDFQNNFTNKI